MDTTLQDLYSLCDESQRRHIADQWKRDKKKVVGILCSYVPEEIIHAAGMLPWRMMGTQKAATPHADLYRPTHTCLYCNHVLESLLLNQYDFLDAVVATSWDQDLIRLWDVFQYLGKTPNNYILHLPLSRSVTHKRQFVKEVKKFFRFVEELAGREITAEALRHSIQVYNRLRELFHGLYELRKRETPPLTGAEMLALTTSSLLAPKEMFIEGLEAALPILDRKENDLKTNRPRILISSDRLDNPELLKAIEETGCLVAMDDLDTGSRHLWNRTQITASDSLDDLLGALADRYHSQPASPCMMTWREQVEDVIGWVREYHIQGVLELPLMYSRSRQMRAPYFKKKLQEAGIPVASFEREYHLANVGQLKTRAGAFVEMIQST